MDPAVIYTALVGAVTALFGLLVKMYEGRIAELKENHKAATNELRESHKIQLAERDTRISQLEQDKDGLEAKVEKMSDVLAKNTSALGQAAAAQETVAHLLGTLVPTTSPSSRGTPTP